MLRVTPLQAREGMELALPLGHPVRVDRVLLSAGSRLTARTITRLREIGVEHLWIRYPGLADLERWVSPALAEARITLRQSVHEALTCMQRQDGAPLEFGPYRRAVAGVVSKLLDRRMSAVLIDDLAAGDAPAIRHAGSVCYLSMLIGLRLDAYLLLERRRLRASAARDVSGLGLAGMLHDVGMLKLEGDDHSAWLDEPTEDNEVYRSHVRLSYEALRGGLDAASASAVLHHHQRFDGSGFPDRKTLSGEEPLAGRQIHIFARVLAAADLFDQVRHGCDGPFPLTDAMNGIDRPCSTVRALGLLQQAPFKDWIDPIVLRGLLAVVPPFAPGTIVRLSTGDDAVVCNWDARDPCRPVVRLIGDADELEGHDGALPEVDLRVMGGVSVVEAEGVDVSSDQFGPIEDAATLDSDIERMNQERAAERLSYERGAMDRRAG